MRFRFTLAAMAGSLVLVLFVSEAPGRDPYYPLTVYDQSLADSQREVWRQHLGEIRLTSGSIHSAQARKETEELLRQWYGERPFQSNFPEGFALDLRKKGVGEVVAKAMAPNRANAKGYIRQLKFMNNMELAKSPLRLLEADNRVRFEGKIVEFDIVAEELKTGRKVVYESKDWKIQTRADLEKAKEQATRIARRARAEGIASVSWVNREGIREEYLEEFSEHVRKLGMKADFEVSTGPKTVASGKAKKSFAEIMERDAKIVQRKVFYGKLFKRAVPIAGTVYEGSMAVNSFVQWRGGAMSTRELVIRSGGALGGAGGAWAGAVSGAAIGAAVGTFVPFIGNAAGGVIGGIVGGIAVGCTGDATGRWAAEKLADAIYFSQLKEAENDELFKFVKRLYAQSDGLTPSPALSLH